MRALTVKSGHPTSVCVSNLEMDGRTRVGDTRGKELADGSEEEEVEVGEGRRDSVASCSSGDDNVLELFKELQTTRQQASGGRTGRGVQ